MVCGGSKSILYVTAKVFTLYVMFSKLSIYWKTEKNADKLEICLTDLRLHLMYVGESFCVMFVHRVTDDC